MAVYKGREVSVLGRSNGEDVSPMYDILDQWGERSSVKLNELQFTGKEVEDLKKQHVDHLTTANVIEDKDLQELKDSQDKKKIEEKQAKAPQYGDVAVSKIKIPAEEIQKSQPQAVKAK